VNITVLPQLRDITGLPSYRTSERLKLTGATEHGEASLLVYNQHQPSSGKREFKPNHRTKFLQAVMRRNDTFRNETTRNETNETNETTRK
jgi:hypothetical protein